MKKSSTNKKDLFVELVRTTFKVKYNNSLLGFLWVLLKPLFTFIVLYFVFSRFKGGWVENYQIYLLLGIILYTFFNEGILYGLRSILRTSHIILKVKFPQEIVLASFIFMAIINLFVNLSILAFFSLFNPISPTVVSILYFIFIVVVLFLFIYGISFFTSILLVKLRDLEHITELMMQLMFYATPIFYPLESLPESMKKIIVLNPLTSIIQASRQALIYGKIDYVFEIGMILAISVVLLLIGSVFFKKNIKKISELF